MSYAEKVAEIMKTRKGKLFTLLLVLTVIFTFTGIAYGTSESGKDLEDQLAQNEDGIEVNVETEQDESADEDSDDTVPIDDEAVEQDGEVPDEATDEPEVDLAVPRVVTDGVVEFNAVNADQAKVVYQDSQAPASITIDPESVTESNPFVFSVVPAEGYEVDEVSFVSTFNDRAKPVVPAENDDTAEGENVAGVPVADLPASSAEA